MASAALLLDLDGTVWRSTDWYTEIIAAATSCAVPRIERALRERPVARVLADLGVTKARFTRLCHERAETLVVFDGVRDTLAHLAGRGIAIGAVTNLPGWVANPMLRATRIEPILDVVIAYGATHRHKPAPDPLLAALSALGVPATPRSWYIGDTADDRRAASAAGISFVWAGYAEADLPPDAVDAVAAMFTEVEDLFG